MLLAVAGSVLDGAGHLHGRRRPQWGPVQVQVTVAGPDVIWAHVWAMACFLDQSALDAVGPAWSAYRVLNVTA